MAFIASNLHDFDQVLAALLCAYRANAKLQPYIRYLFCFRLTFSGWVLAILSTFPHLSETIGFQLASWKVSPGVIRSVPFSSISFQVRRADATDPPASLSRQPAELTHPQPGGEPHRRQARHGPGGPCGDD